MATTARPMGPRALPSQQQQQQPVAYESPAWYEAEQRMAPSYIQMQKRQQQPYFPQQPQHQQQLPFPTQNHPQGYSNNSNLPPGAALPYHYHANNSNESAGRRPQQQQNPRLNASRFQSYPTPDMGGGGGYAPGQSARHPGANGKGSAFMVGKARVCVCKYALT